ncbi:MAG: hypothetical protein LUC33_03095 [Prevotellaceae bacterium]|nr:hypothetical protein [Prevotellaceae bacterium]
MRLYDALARYVTTGMAPDSLNRTERLVWRQIRLEADLLTQRQEEIRLKRRKAAEARWRKESAQGGRHPRREARKAARSLSHTVRGAEHVSRKPHQGGDNASEHGRPSRLMRAYALAFPTVERPVKLERKEQETEKRERTKENKDKEEGEERLNTRLPQSKNNNNAPAREDVRRYAREARPGINADRFFDFYESKDWRVGAAPMANWRASLRKWDASGDKTLTCQPDTGRRSWRDARHIQSDYYAEF